MPIEETCGTFNMGRWGDGRMGMGVIWRSTDRDPYTCIEFPHDTSREIDAKTALAEAGELPLIDGTTGGIDEIVRMQELFIKTKTNLDLFMEYYRESVMSTRMIEAAVALMKDAGYDLENSALCISPSCHFINSTDGLSSMNECPACGKVTAVRASDLPAVPDACVVNLLAYNMHSLTISNLTNNDFVKMADTDKAKLVFMRSRILLAIDTGIPQLTARGDHFIRARVNRSVLADMGHTIPTDSDWNIQFIGGSRANLRVVIRLMADDNIVLDPSRADQFREEYIDDQWSEEYVAFVTKLRHNGILRVDSAGLNETLTALYNIVQNAGGIKSIIKKNGKVVFPTADVVGGINKLALSKAFSLTEHNQYGDIDEVFCVEDAT